jgi:hypothetical protein
MLHLHAEGEQKTQWLQSELLASGSIFEIRIIFDDHWSETLGHKYALCLSTHEKAKPSKVWKGIKQLTLTGQKKLSRHYNL